MRVYFFELPLPGCPGGPVWSWLRSPFPQPGFAEGLLAACCGTGAATLGGGGGVAGGRAVRGLGLFDRDAAVRGLCLFDSDGAGSVCGAV
jgi:hypothetical protein